jgi:hypothetical protein
MARGSLEGEKRTNWLLRGALAATLVAAAVGAVQCGMSRSTGTTPGTGESATGAAGGSGTTATSTAGSTTGTTTSGSVGAPTSGSVGAPTSGSVGAGGASTGATASSGAVGGSGGGTAGASASGAPGASDAAAGSGATGAHPASLNNFDGPVFYITKGDGTLHALQEGTWTEIGTWSGLPILDAIRGTDADPVAGVMYFTHGAAGPNSTGIADKMGSLGAWDLYQNKLVYDVKLTHGVDQPSYGLGVVYVPDGEYTNDTNWSYYSAVDGTLIGTEPGGLNPHDTVWKNGHRYYGGTQDTNLYVLGLPFSKIGPSPSGTAGVRPFTINGPETRAYITWSNYRGFSVADLTTGQIIKSISFGGNPCIIAPSHGITLSPDNSEVYVMDSCVNTIRAYTATDDPQPIAAVMLTHLIHGGTEMNCAWDCNKDGWLLHSRDGKYVYVADSGDVIDTTTHTVATYIDYLANCRHGFIEMDWNKGTIVGTTTHVGLGY